jgi:hypothetical protein
MNRARQVVSSVALGAALVIIASAVSSETNGPADSGWFMYAPNSTTTTYSTFSNSSVLPTAVVWLAAVAVWFFIAWRIFRSDE